MKISYRPEIDGLRAIAVGLVVLYHAQITILGIKPFQGGFVGVDIFFVISGYLITSIILKEIIFTGTFSFQYFYERRIRRIIPALLFVILISLPFSYLILLPHNLIEFSKSIFFSIGFSSNFYFHYSGQEYNGPNNLLLPFLHTWSLSVEEQYYIIFPLILMIAFRYLRKYLLTILVIGFVFSFAMANLITKDNPSISFYFLHTRMWEMLSGSILAYMQIVKGVKNEKKILSIIFPFLGLCLIGFSSFFFNDKILHPSFYTLIPVSGACLFIWFSNKREITYKILSSKLFVSVGLISYSIYLWHYPIFSFYRIFSSEFPIFSLICDKILIIFLIILFSLITYFFIEKPFRKKNIKFDKIIKLLFVKLIIILIFITVSFFTKGFQFRVPDEIKDKIFFLNFYDPLYRNCFTKFNYKTDDYCKDTQFKKNIFILGDSRSAYLLNDLKIKVNKEKINLNILTMPKGRVDFSNTPLQNFIIKNLLEIKNSFIVISGAYNTKQNNFNFLEKTQDFINLFEKLKKNNNQIIFVQPLPIPDYHPYSTSQASMRLVKKIKKNNIKDLKFDKKDYLDSLKYYLIFKDVISQKFENVHFLKVEDLFCDFDFCYTIKDGYILFDDPLHPSAFSVKLINDLIVEKVQSIGLNFK